VRQIWYVSYGSNMHIARLGRYLAGCRDSRPPMRSVPVEVPGTVYFATESAVWTGGRAFYDPDAAGVARARAHLITAEQLSDIVAQEMAAAPGPGADLDLSGVLEHGRAAVGPGRYETLVRAGELDGLPLLTFTAPWGVYDIGWNPPAAAYLGHIATGLLEAGAWEADSIAGYLGRLPGCAGHWGAEEIAAVVQGADDPDADPDEMGWQPVSGG
jgi:hypothetical protein